MDTEWKEQGIKQFFTECNKTKTVKEKKEQRFIVLWELSKIQFTCVLQLDCDVIALLT